MRWTLTLFGLLVFPGWIPAVSSVDAMSRASMARASGSIVLGSTSYYAPQSRGWGTVKPRMIFNGGDPSGLVSGIRWQHWGQTSAIGWGVTAIFKPAGGYYSKLVRAELRATDIGRCTAAGPLAYRRLSIRVPARPGGPLRPWSPWGNGTVCKSP